MSNLLIEDELTEYPLYVPMKSNKYVKKNGAHFNWDKKCWFVRGKKHPLIRKFGWVNLNDNYKENPEFQFEYLPVGALGNTVRNNEGNDAWFRIRPHVFKRAKYKCELCGVKAPLDCHESWSFKDNTQKLEKLMGVCRKCHDCIHLNHRAYGYNIQDLLEHIQNVLKVPKEELLKMSEIAENRKTEIDNIDWDFDSSCLEFIENT
jgi:hypothetical protein